ncbi:MAG: SGNH/GDSL hydrolase family protein [Salibacteraceae bacterium]
MKKNYKPGLLKKGVFSVIPLFLLLLFAEVFLRVFRPNLTTKSKFAIVSVFEKFHSPNPFNQSSDRSIRMRERQPEFFQCITPNYEQLSNSDALIEKEYCLTTDSNGFIQPSRIHSSPEISIVFLGGSTTECEFVSEKVRFPYLTGRLIESKLDKKTNSYNAACSGNNIMHSIDLLLHKVIPINPDIVVLMHAVNDWNVLVGEKTYWNSHHSKSLIIDPRSESIFKKKNGSISESDTAENYNLERIVFEYFQAQNLFVDICERYHIQPVLMTQSSRFTNEGDEIIHKGIRKFNKERGYSYSDSKLLQDTLNSITRTTAIQRGILLIDLDKEIPKTKEFMYDIVHYHDQGSKAIAAIISDSLISRFKWNR